MQSPFPLSVLLLPEIESEFIKTRRVLESVPDGRGDFKPHEKSRSLASLAGHTADLVSFMEMVLTRPSFDFGTQHRTPLVMQSQQQLCAAFDNSAGKTSAALKDSSDEASMNHSVSSSTVELSSPAPATPHTGSIRSTTSFTTAPTSVSISGSSTCRFLQSTARPQTNRCATRAR